MSTGVGALCVWLCLCLCPSDRRFVFPCDDRELIFDGLEERVEVPLLGCRDQDRLWMFLPQGVLDLLQLAGRTVEWHKAVDFVEGDDPRLVSQTKVGQRALHSGVLLLG